MSQDKKIKIVVKTLGKNKNKAIAYNKENGSGYTISKGDINRVYCDIGKFMVSIGKLSVTTMNAIKEDLFKPK